MIPAGWHQRCRLHDIDSWRRRAYSKADEHEHEQEKGMMSHFLFFIAGILLVGLYGGYFGAGIGILMIGALSFISRGDIRHVVALKNFVTLCMRGVAVLVLVLEGDVNWNYGVPMALGGLVGGYVGGMVSHRADRKVVRSIVIAIGFAASAYYLWKLYGTAVMPAGAE
jgi:uncharacterized protein